MSAFVGTRTVASVEELRSLIQQFQGEPSCFFLRWPHKVSGFCNTLPDDFPSPEGQMFDRQKELRWKQQRAGYHLLWLSHQSDPVSGFAALDGDWETWDCPAQLHDAKETQYPKGFYFGPGVNPRAVQQRYFRDRRTATVHFVALTLTNQP